MTTDTLPPMRSGSRKAPKSERQARVWYTHSVSEPLTVAGTAVGRKLGKRPIAFCASSTIAAKR
jgi:hypothetical protein